MGSIVDGTVVLLYKRHQVVKEILAEKIELHRIAVTLPHQTGRITVRKHDNHLLGSTLSNEIIQNEVHLTHLEINFFGIGRTADKIHNRIFLLRVLIICRRCINNGITKHTHRIRPVVHIVHFAMRHILERMNEVPVSAHIKQTVLKAFIGEPLSILGVHHLMTVDNETIRINVGNCRAERNGPHIVFTFLHLVAASKLHIDHHLFGMFILIVKRYSIVRIHNRRRRRSRTSWLSI